METIITRGAAVITLNHGRTFTRPETVIKAQIDHTIIEAR
jgi:hypothetical protein